MNDFSVFGCCRFGEDRLSNLSFVVVDVIVAGEGVFCSRISRRASSSEKNYIKSEIVV